MRCSALRASRASTTHEMLISDAPWLIISMFTFPSASVVNMRPAIPTMFRIWCPTSDRIAMSWCTVTWPPSACGGKRSTQKGAYRAVSLQVLHEALQRVI